MVIGLTTDPDHTLIADGIVGHNTNDSTKTMLPQAFNKIFMAGDGAVRSAMLYEQMGRCVDVLPSRRWRVAGKGSDRVLAALIGIMGMYVEFEGGQVHGVTSGGPRTEESGLPADMRAACENCGTRAGWTEPAEGLDWIPCRACGGRVRLLQRGSYDAEWERDFEGRTGGTANYLREDWNV